MEALQTWVVTLVPPAAVVLIWLIRLEGRVNTGEALHREMRDEVRYIRERIDEALNGKK